MREDAEAHILVSFPEGEIEAFPVANEGQLLEVLIESTAVTKGAYQLALVFTQRGGDAFQIRDWYNGFAGLTSFGHFKISGGMPGSEAEDVDGDGLIDKLVNPDNLEVEATGTVSVCVEQAALTRRAEADNSETQAAENRAETTTQFELKPAVDKALKVFSELKLITDTYYAEMGHFPLSFDEISPYLVKESQSLVADIQLNVQEPFYYQLTLKDDLEPALTGKTLQFAYEPTTRMWHCGPGSFNGLDTQYLPASCRH
ncbi:MAG: hypothetical protein DRR00_16100 [Candidatus Parabeggiatoa sp. nov. 3]|nr:MAG: hypothetical protein DRR00_16100 [Gammaproteobacteria bacterium]RKZ62089.1 MAG: hypothetical protein DRQ99_19365 [Gammaproteobacteria bacterium]HEW97860.1 hypothetical protein [Beggiatoa sp.]